MFWCYFSTQDKYLGQKYSPKNNYFSASFNNDKGLSLENKKRIMLTEIPEVKYIRYMRSHNSGNIHGENVHIWAIERKKLFLEN